MGECDGLEEIARTCWPVDDLFAWQVNMSWDPSVLNVRTRARNEQTLSCRSLTDIPFLFL